MKKLILLCCLLLSISLVGCSDKPNDDVIDARETDRFITIYLGNGDYVYVDKETGVQYLYIYNGSAGDVEVLLNADGKPILYEGEL